MSLPITFINPSTLEMSTSSISSPADTLKRAHDQSNEAESSASARKRARTSTSSNTGPESPAPSDDRKEARAHRNRIAAQNSRDRRKVYLSDLERKVAELEAENQALRGGASVAPLDDRQSQKDKENEELRERIRTLERGWDAVIKALAAQGITATSSTQPTTATTTATETLIPTSTDIPSTSHPTTSPSYPISPALSNSSSTDFDFDLTVETPMAPSFLPLSPPTSPHGSDLAAEDSTRHLARVATTEQPSVSLQRVVSKDYQCSKTLSSPASPARSHLRPRSRLRTPASTTTQWKSCSERSSGRLRHQRRGCHRSPLYLLMTRPRKRV
ncbi:hypothetical protein BDV98DRAFT_323922 [Pterulicium gracile]|uniref:BZIP domain-containing protein n=1 Tax=Pterulicium gracile TaxID=1884261 RepID=A0A5C3QRH6_9AGAR|nr:hypothetical protein BDV98DRAFT_323922 [Pterula gracilis]